MSLKAKYDPVLKLGEELGVTEGYWKEEGGIIKMGGKTKTPYERDQIFNKIVEVGGARPTDIVAKIDPASEEHYHVHEVVSGDTFWGIAEKYYGKGNLYPQIHAYNPDVVAESPNTIHVGWVLNIPHKPES